MWTFARGSENILITSKTTGWKLQLVVSLRVITTIIQFYFARHLVQVMFMFIFHLFFFCLFLFVCLFVCLFLVFFFFLYPYEQHYLINSPFLNSLP